jgi:phosphatidylinositol alpha-1,6-mannosyltransferase
MGYVSPMEFELHLQSLTQALACTPMSIVATEVRPGYGGIARVARLMLKSLLFAQAPRCITLTNCSKDDVFGVDVLAARGSRVRFAALLAREWLARRRLIYDFGGLARIHPRFGVPPYACWMHGIEAWEGAQVRRIPALRRSQLLLANSHYTIARARRVFGDFDHAQVCWLGTEEDEPAPRLPPRDGPPCLLTVARLDKDGYKGHAEILRTWGAVRERVPGVDQ